MDPCIRPLVNWKNCTLTLEKACMEAGLTEMLEMRIKVSCDYYPYIESQHQLPLLRSEVRILSLVLSLSFLFCSALPAPFPCPFFTPNLAAPPLDACEPFGARQADAVFQAISFQAALLRRSALEATLKYANDSMVKPQA